MYKATCVLGAQKGVVNLLIPPKRCTVAGALLKNETTRRGTISRACNRRRELLPSGAIPAGLSAAAAVAIHLAVSNLAWAEEPADALSVLQVADPPTQELAAVPPSASQTQQPAEEPILTAPDLALAPDVTLAASLASEPAAAPSELAAAAVESPVVHMDIPTLPVISSETDIQTLVAALVRNERFTSALLNNEAFLDRLAGEER
ncbi:hypothetical protein Agub_g10229, partial [Astrephomene gubernaculifera]